MTIRAHILPALTVLGALLSAASAHAANSDQREAYTEEEIINAAENFFSSGAKGLAQVLQKALKDKGRPVAIIQGEEVGGAIGIGVRYGNGRLKYKGQGTGQKIFWQGPSIGFDIGANAVKVFALVYDLPATSTLFQRYPGVDGSLYFVGGFGVNYVQSGATVIAPVRFGVGWRQGINFGYMHFTPRKRINPF